MLINSLKCCSKHIGSTAFDFNVYSCGGTHRRWYAKSNKTGCCTNVPQTAGRTVEPWPKNDPPPPQWRCECPQDPMPYNNDPYRIKVPEVVVPPMPPGNAKPSIDCARKGTCTPSPPPPPPCPPVPKKPFSWFYILVTTAFLAAMGVVYKYWAYNDKLMKSGIYDEVWRPRLLVRRPYHDADLPPCVQYLIIGTGPAGWTAYNTIMKHDEKAKVFFVTKEDILPYERLPMSKFMWWNKLPPNMKTLKYFDQKYKTMYLSECKHFMDPVKFFRKEEGPAVSIASGWCVLRIDAENHIAYIKTLCGERPMYYEKALIAVGSQAINLNIFKIASKEVRSKMTTFRKIRDLEIAFRKVREARHVTVIGGGPLGCELAWHLAKMEEKVEKDEKDKYKPPLQIAHMYKDAGILGNILPEYLGEWAAEKIKCEGVNIMPKTTPEDAFLTKDGRLELTLNDGSSLITDYVFVCIGTKPRMDIAEPSFLEEDKVNGGFLVNTELAARTHLYAAGDAASFYSQWKNTRQRFQNYIPAVEQGELAGYNMTGYWDPCNIENSSWLTLGDVLEMQVVGDVGACMPIIALFKPCRPEDLPPKQREEGESMLLRCYKDSAEYRERYKRGMLCYLRDETIVGFVFWNMPPIADRKEVATEILRARPHYNDINLVADLLGFSETHCVYLKPEEMIEPGPCIQAYREF
ncbi:apoptosis-inducing factor 1, mitochondrial-like [Cydia fagiglandana]|uniref:apoptosis-inducing factor 1, mitochondrial-like n=1 Tax=Cydia fagiglandana TaxID=1458189 RepID=UPI002FEE46DB